MDGYTRLSTDNNTQPKSCTGDFSQPRTNTISYVRPQPSAMRRLSLIRVSNEYSVPRDGNTVCVRDCIVCVHTIYSPASTGCPAYGIGHVILAGDTTVQLNTGPGPLTLLTQQPETGTPAAP